MTLDPENDELRDMTCKTLRISLRELESATDQNTNIELIKFWAKDVIVLTKRLEEMDRGKVSDA